MEARRSLSRLLVVGIVIILLQVACTTSSKTPAASNPTGTVPKEEVSTSTPTVTPSLVPTATNTATPLADCHTFTSGECHWCDQTACRARLCLCC